MKKWMRGIRGSILMIVLWVIGWSLGFGGIMEAFFDPDGKHLTAAGARRFTEVVTPAIVRLYEEAENQ